MDGLAEEGGGAFVHGSGGAGAVGEAGDEVVLEVLADLGAVDPDGEAEVLEGGAVADAGEHEQFGRDDRPGAEDGFAGCGEDGGHSALWPGEGAGCAAVLDEDSVGDGVGEDAEVGAVAGGAEVALGGADATAAAGVELHGGDAIDGVGGVDVGEAGEAGVGAGVDEGGGAGAEGAGFANGDGAALAAVGVLGAAPILDPSEGGEDVVEGPAAGAGLGPAVIVVGGAAEEDEALMEPEPPRTLPRGQFILRLSRLGSGSVANRQSNWRWRRAWRTRRGCGSRDGGLRARLRGG